MLVLSCRELIQGEWHEMKVQVRTKIYALETASIFEFLINKGPT